MILSLDLNRIWIWMNEFWVINFSKLIFLWNPKNSHDNTYIPETKHIVDIDSKGRYFFTIRWKGSKMFSNRSFIFSVTEKPLFGRGGVSNGFLCGKCLKTYKKWSLFIKNDFTKTSDPMTLMFERGHLLQFYDQLVT